MQVNASWLKTGIYAILQRISTSIKVVHEHFSPALTLFEILYIYIISRNCVTFKIQIEVKMYNIDNGAIRWLVSISIKVVLEHFCQLSPFSRFCIFIYFNKFSDIENMSRLRLLCKICYGAIRWQVSASIKVVLQHFPLAHTVFQIVYIYISRNCMTFENIDQDHDVVVVVLLLAVASEGRR